MAATNLEQLLVDEFCSLLFKVVSRRNTLKDQEPSTQMDGLTISVTQILNKGVALQPATPPVFHLWPVTKVAIVVGPGTPRSRDRLAPVNEKDIVVPAHRLIQPPSSS